MDEKRRPLHMKHTAPHFWQYAAAYILLGSGTLLIVGEVAEWALVGKELSLVGGLIAIWIGVMALAGLKRSRQKGPSPDRPEYGNDGERNDVDPGAIKYADEVSLKRTE